MPKISFIFTKATNFTHLITYVIFAEKSLAHTLKATNGILNILKGN